MNTHSLAAFHDPVFEFIPDHKTSDFWMISAWNPDETAAPHTHNHAADARLRGDISALGHTPFRVIALARDESHAEQGWAFTCDQATAMEIGRRHGQLAVFHFHVDGIELVHCWNGECQPLIDPHSRWKDPRDVRQFTLFVGSSSGCKEFDSQQYEAVRALVGERFDGFTIQHAEGCFRSGHEATLLVHISTRDADKVLGLAHKLRSALVQTGIGISHNGVYQRVREWTDDLLILQSFGLSAL